MRRRHTGPMDRLQDFAAKSGCLHMWQRVAVSVVFVTVSGGTLGSDPAAS